MTLHEDQAQIKRERRAARDSSFSGYARRNLEERKRKAEAVAAAEPVVDPEDEDPWMVTQSKDKESSD